MLKSLRATAPERDSRLPVAWHGPSCLSDELLIRVDRPDPRAETREPHREAAISASDFEDALAAPIGHLLQCAHFIFVRIN